MIFEWDEEKNSTNKKKHGISFETASYIFKDPHYIEMYDIDHSNEEDRFIAIGMVGNILFVVFTERKNTNHFCKKCDGGRKEVIL
ncbi:MAG: BrnT family toxin [Stomatobaculum sp.]